LRAYANLAAECVDTLRGTVLVHLALDSEWDRGIEPTFNLSQRSRIVLRREVLALPRAREREDLLRLLLERVPEPHAGFPWPLGEARLQRLRTEPGMTPRMLLIEFRRALDGEPEQELTAAESTVQPGDSQRAEAAPREIDGEWARLLDAARGAVHSATEDRVPLEAARIADGFLAVGKFLTGLELQARATPPACLLLQTKRGSELLSVLDQSNHRSISSVLGKLLTASAKTPVVVLRERARELPPTWTETLRKREALLATVRARWIDIDPEDCARMLALAALLQAARSGDVTDTRGGQVSEREVCAWVTDKLAVERWPISGELDRTAEEPRASTPAEPPVAAAQPAAPRPASPGAVASASALPTLRRLRVASFERLVREVARLDPASTRASILAELDAAGESVRWLSRSIVFLRRTE